MKPLFFPRRTRALYAWRGISIGALALLLAAGCSNAPGTSSPTPAAAPAAGRRQDLGPFGALEKGIAVEKVHETVGAPEKVSPLPMDSPVKGEIWLYRRQLPSGIRQVIVGTERRTGVDPISNQEYTYEVPVYRNETDLVTQTIELLMIEGKFTELRQSISKEAAYH